MNFFHYLVNTDPNKPTLGDATIDLSNNKMMILPHNIEALADFLIDHPYIKKLSLANCFSIDGISKEMQNMIPMAIMQLQKIVSEKKFATLIELDLSNNKTLDSILDELLLDISKTCDKLKTLKLSNVGLGDAHLNELADSEPFHKMLKGISSLDLSHNNISSNGIKYLLSSIPSKFNESGLDNDQQQTFQTVYNFLNYFLNLEELNLSYNSIDNKAMHKLTKKIYSLENLHTLYLEGNPMGVSGYAELSHAIKTSGHKPITMHFANHKTVTQEKIEEINNMLNDSNYSEENFNHFLNDLHNRELYLELSMDNMNRYHAVSEDIKAVIDMKDAPKEEVDSVVKLLSEIKDIHLRNSIIDYAASTVPLLGKSDHKLTDYDSDDDNDSCVIS